VLPARYSASSRARNTDRRDGAVASHGRYTRHPITSVFLTSRCRRGKRRHSSPTRRPIRRVFWHPPAPAATASSQVHACCNTRLHLSRHACRCAASSALTRGCARATQAGGGWSRGSIAALPLLARVPLGASSTARAGACGRTDGRALRWARGARAGRNGRYPANHSIDAHRTRLRLPPLPCTGGGRRQQQPGESSCAERVRVSALASRGRALLLGSRQCGGVRGHLRW